MHNLFGTPYCFDLIFHPIFGTPYCFVLIFHPIFGTPCCFDLIFHPIFGTPCCFDLIFHPLFGTPCCFDLICHPLFGTPCCFDLIFHPIFGTPCCFDLIFYPLLGVLCLEACLSGGKKSGSNYFVKMCNMFIYLKWVHLHGPDKYSNLNVRKKFILCDIISQISHSVFCKKWKKNFSLFIVALTNSLIFLWF